MYVCKKWIVLVQNRRCSGLFKHLTKQLCISHKRTNFEYPQRILCSIKCFCSLHIQSYKKNINLIKNLVHLYGFFCYLNKVLGRMYIICYVGFDEFNLPFKIYASICKS